MLVLEINFYDKETLVPHLFCSMLLRPHCTKDHLFFFQMFWKDRLSKHSCTGIWSFLYYQEGWCFFPKIWSENESWSFSKNSSKYDTFCIFSKDSIFSLQIWYYNEIMKFSVSLKKIVCILDNMVFLLIEKLKMIKKVHIYKNVLMILCAFIESFIGTFIYCHPMKKKTGNFI